MNANMQLQATLTRAAVPVSRAVIPGHLQLGVSKVDSGAVVPAKEDDLVDLGLTGEEAVDQAVQRMRKSTLPTDLRSVDTVPGMFFLAAADGQAAARLILLPELVDNVPLGGLLAAVPRADQLLVVPLASAGDLDALQVLATAVNFAATQAAATLSDQLYWYDGEQWHHLPVIHGDEDVSVVPPRSFLARVNQLASMDLVRETAEA